MRQRVSEGIISEGQIFHLVVGRDYFSDGFGNLNRIRDKAERERARKRVRRDMRRAWSKKKVRDRAWKMNEERRRDKPPWAALEFGDPDGRLDGGEDASA